MELPSRFWLGHHRGLYYRSFKKSSCCVDQTDDWVRIFVRSKMLLKQLESREKSSIDAHILSLDDGRPHTCANTPTLCTRGQIDNVDWDYDIRSFGSHVGIICTPSNSFDSQLSMWNWETGNLIRRVSQVDSFAFLTENLIVYAPIEEEGTLGRRLIVLDLVLYPLVKLELPSFTKWSEICIHSESPPTRFEYLPNHQQVPFRVSRQDRLFAVGCRMWDNSHMDMVIFVPLSTLLSHVEKARISALVTVLEWKSWGPTATRTLPFDFPDIWVCYIHGLRAAVLNRNTSSLSGVCFDIYDLNPLLDRQREDSQEASNSAGREPRRAISGHLPDISPSSLMLSEDALLVVSGDETEITVYSF
ncbi:hypothetical protein E1B28_004396 [Marasmius oreades]|uniref:Uncharacterized protein n=1 Tax=Marasmius oreades TaxID=181124 RepID=A0A9P8ACX3_9AGAR|nr:uncharacterized protein E1B28_004396 [Marasmius oreades]KAG7097002.1 hypothetical protein E1B28_004396 [Marasmius oreades]